MHVIRWIKEDKAWSVGYWHPQSFVWQEVDLCESKMWAIRLCSALNGGRVEIE